MRPRDLVFAGLLAATSACGPRVGPLPAALSEGALARALELSPSASSDALGKGRQLYIDHCEECHGYPDVWFYDAKKWPKIMKEMAEKAEITQAESDLVLNFILTAKTDPRPADPPKK